MAMLRKELSSLNQRLSAPSPGQKMMKAVAGVARAVAGAAFVGYVVWILRAGSLLASALAGLPMWRFLDPLPVLDLWRKRKASGDDVDDEDSDDKNSEKLESMFG
jgi:hypothetical protein